MKNIRLFINNDLQQPVNWVQMNADGKEEHGTSELSELSNLEGAVFEIYLSPDCCTIIKTSVEGISTKRLTEELLLGLIEENLVDEIDDVKAVMLRTEDNAAYVAVFNKEFYNELANYVLHANVKFIQSFVYTTNYQEDAWTVYLSSDTKFLRTSLYEFFVLDDEKPLSLLLTEMLSGDNKPQSLLVYADDETYKHLNTFGQTYGINLTRINDKFDYSTLVWNFYKQKTTRFKLKLNNNARFHFLKLLNSFKYIAIALIGFWLMSITLLNINIYRLISQIKSNVKGIVNIKDINQSSVIETTQKLITLLHKRGMYADNDAMILFKDFLEVVSTVSTNDIKQIMYQSNTLKIVLGSDVDISQLKSYTDILLTKRVVMTIKDYKTYYNDNKLLNKGNNSAVDSDDKNDMISDAQWVVILKPLAFSSN